MRSGVVDQPTASLVQHPYSHSGPHKQKGRAYSSPAIAPFAIGVQRSAAEFIAIKATSY